MSNDSTSGSIATSSNASPENTSTRSSLIDSAVKFLRDEKIRSAPLAKKIAFLESKGLSNEDIQKAIALALGPSSQSSQSSNTTTSVQHQQPQVPIYYSPLPPTPKSERDWRDVFIGLVTATSVGYGIFYAAQKFWPEWFPTRPEFEVQQDALAEHLKDSKKTLESATEKVTQNEAELETQIQLLAKAVEDIRTCVAEAQTKQADQENAWKQVKEDVALLQTSLPNALNQAKEHQAGVLSDLQSELKSLKALLVNRRFPIPTPPKSVSPELKNASSDSNEDGSTCTTVNQ